MTAQRRDKLAHHKKPYAHATADCETLEECVDKLRPSVLIGVAAVGQAYLQQAIIYRHHRAIASLEQAIIYIYRARRSR